MINKLQALWARLNEFKTSDPDDIRRGKLLNILLAGIFVLSFLSIVITLILLVVAPPPSAGDADVLLIVYAAVACILGSAGLYLVNIRSRKWTALLLLLLLTVVFVFCDTPYELAVGRSSFVFIIPIAISSLLLAPASSFLFAILNACIVTGLAIAAGVFPNVTAIFGFFMLAIISWLSARGLEQALNELRTTNTELDRRVVARTQDLSDALGREQAEAGRRQAILQGIADGVVVFDNQAQAIMTNPAIGRLLDIPLEQFAQRSFHDILDSPQIEAADRATLLTVLDATDQATAPMRVRWGLKTLSVSAAPVRDLQNNLIGNVAVFRDFTREAEVEEMKNSFVAMVSHELRTPLNAILGYSEMLHDAFYGPLNDKQVNAADRILYNSRRLMDIVSDLLDKAQIEAGHLKMNNTYFSSAELAHGLHSVMDKFANDKGLDLSTCIDPDVPAEIYGDPKRIQQVLVNLVNNAAKFTETGSIRVHIYTAVDETWAFDVIDTGPGIAEEDQKYIFEPFRQVAETVTRSHGGIGLGLSIVKRLVDLMGGHISLKSSLGQGSTFTVCLPFESHPEGAAHES
jgi:signal transduction histidine kinase